MQGPDDFKLFVTEHGLQQAMSEEHRLVSL